MLALLIARTGRLPSALGGGREVGTSPPDLVLLDARRNPGGLAIEEECVQVPAVFGGRACPSAKISDEIRRALMDGPRTVAPGRLRGSVRKGLVEQARQPAFWHIRSR